MTTTRLSLAVAKGAVLGITAQPATAEELSVATPVPPQHHTNAGMFAWCGEEFERRPGGSLQWVVVSNEERARMDAAVRQGLDAIFADCQSNGITNFREIYEALNQQEIWRARR